MNILNWIIQGWAFLAAVDWKLVLAVLPTFAISAIAFTVIIYWWKATKGTWKHYPAGRSLMGLLGIIAVGFGWGVISRILGDYPGRSIIAVTLYLSFIGALVLIGLTIRKEMRLGKRRMRERFPTHTGPVTVTVATKNEETPDEQ